MKAKFKRKVPTMPRTKRKLRVPAWVAIILFGGMIVVAVITMS